MSGIARFVVIIGLLTGGLTGCESSTSIPSGAQQVHVTATTSDVHLDPATARAGDVYLVLDVPDGGVNLIQTQADAGASPGPLSAADLARLSAGDSQGFSTENLSVGCCGNVMRKTLAQGTYAFVPAGTEDGTPPPAVAILAVGP
jgi:hypothetical protein